MIRGKVVFVGDSGVGKTSIIHAFQHVSIDNPPTIGANSMTFKVDLDDNQVNLNVWDTAGQDDFKCLLPVYVRGAEVAVIVFASNDDKSLESIDQWIEFFKESELTQIIIACNKCDLDMKADMEEDINKIRQNYQYEIFYTSAKTGNGIDTLFSAIALVVFQNEKKMKDAQDWEIVLRTTMNPDEHKSIQDNCC